ncbi:MAG TPA: SusF/SusE family outer membrane protein [Bacteroidales bacterium]|nr:SusF/SusE family outer membrane protein [Bacteroidales bacterium]HPT11194.1 SusF/SusE family outer membrane protein [Bacteroidales bacterium]
MKVKIFTNLVLGLLLLAVLPANAQNIIVDGDFSTTTVISPNDGWPPPGVWSTYQVYADANATVVEGVCNYQILSTGFNTWEVQLAQGGFTLAQGHSYRLSFDVKADADRTFGLFLGQQGGSWVNLLGDDRYTQFATTGWQTITLDFTAPCVFDYYKLSFEVGAISISIYFDNVMLTDLGPYEPTIGILGSSLSGWDVDTDMSTADGITYTISGLPLTAGRVKFRQDNSWCVNWGATDFPTGTGYLYGPDIMVTNTGTYDVTFNKITGEYNFACVSSCSPYIGIIGSAVPPGYESGPDIDMITYDGVIYTLGYTFTNGEAKFRSNNSWDMNWGGSTFPTGTASLGGPAIPVAEGAYTVTFNITTGEYSFVYPSIGILGSALGSWTDDIDLQTTDGVIYTLSDYTFADGEVKFRQDNSWDINWGGYTFPSGSAWGYGPNIPVPAGNYNITFNRSTGEYNFVATTCPVAGIICPQTVYTSNTPGLCGAVVNYPAVTPAYNCGGNGVEIIQTGGMPSGSLFPIGVTTNTFVLTNAEGKTATCSFDVYVWDSESPVISNIADTLAPLWPPNHKMVNVSLDYEVTDNCVTSTSELWVYSNEPENGQGDGDTAPDWQILDNHNVLLRAERSAKGAGREYHIIIFSYDNSWNYTFKEVLVMVPHDMGKVKVAEVKPDNTNHTDGPVNLTVSVWPNPSSSNFSLQVISGAEEPIEFTLTDITGKLISKENIMNNQTISFGVNMSPGIYIVQIKQNNNTRMLKIMKQ